MSDLWTFRVNPSAEGCSSACTFFLKMLLKFIMAVRGQLQNFEVEIINISQSHYPPSGNVQVIFLKFKMVTIIFATAKTVSLIYGGG